MRAGAVGGQGYGVPWSWSHLMWLWELNPGPLGEQQVLFISESPL